ncbi:MAG: glycerophosphodiester phosphodiesterase family protein [Acidobacteriota bacterium]|nr:glycerophosphodiester phosphodiesterase family protein [Acidobacteriota bacterium]
MKRSFLSIVFLLPAVLHAQQPLFPFSVDHPGHPLICAHRGRLNGRELENSLSVMRHTYTSGVKMVEFDLRKSSDGQIFLQHDAKLDRTTDGTGALSLYSSKQLQSTMQRDPTSGKPLEPITRFDDLLSWARTTDILLMVDLKNTPPSDAMKVIRKYGLVDRVVLLTFDAKTAEAALAAAPDAQVSMLVHTRNEIDSAIASAHGQPLALYLPEMGDENLYAYARTTGKIVISDALGELDDTAQSDGFAVYTNYLRTHPVDILVSNHALAFSSTH